MTIIQLKDKYPSGLGIYLYAEEDTRENEAGVVAEFKENSMGKEIGLQINDRIIAVNGQTVKGLNTTQLISKLRGEQGSTMIIAVERDDKIVKIGFTIPKMKKKENKENADVIDIKLKKYEMELKRQARFAILKEANRYTLEELRNNIEGYKERCKEKEKERIKKTQEQVDGMGKH